jgi:hypothetical protein
MLLTFIVANVSSLPLLVAAVSLLLVAELAVPGVVDASLQNENLQ